jgi:hypothetical protein
MRSGKKIFIMLGLLAAFWSGCNYFRSDVNKYALTIKFAPANAEDKLEDVSAIVGADKFWWAEFRKGEEQKIDLFTKKNPDTNLTLLYSINGQKQTWESPSFSENGSYRINLEIDSKGGVKEKICQMPCELN